MTISPIGMKQIHAVFEKYDPFLGIATGIITAQQPDNDNEELDYDRSKPYFEAWSAEVKKDSDGKSLGNVRLQHDPKRPAGKLTDLVFDDANKTIRATAKIVDPTAKSMLAEGVLTGFSIGGSYVDKTVQKDGTTLYVANPIEVSVVDRPCLGSATFDVVRADGRTELRKFRKSQAAIKAAGDESFDAIRCKVQAELDEQHADPKNNIWVWIKDIFPDSVVYECMGSDEAGKLFQVSYEQDGDEIELGDPQEVRTAYVPVEDQSDPDELKEASAQLASLEKLLDKFTKNLATDKSFDFRTLVTELEKDSGALTTMNEKDFKKAHASLKQKIEKAKDAISAHYEKMGKVHKAMHDDMHDHLDGMAKVLGGGPDSGGDEDEIERMDPRVVPQDDERSDYADKSLSAAAIKKQIRDGILELAKAMSGAQPEANSFKPVSKSSDGANSANDANAMTDQDWADYRNERGAKARQAAIAKAQKSAGSKWGAVPARILARKY